MLAFNYPFYLPITRQLILYTLPVTDIYSALLFESPVLPPDKARQIEAMVPFGMLGLALSGLAIPAVATASLKGELHKRQFDTSGWTPWDLQKQTVEQWCNPSYDTPEARARIWWESR